MKILFAEIHFEQNFANNKIYMYVFIPSKILENNLTLGLHAPFQYLIVARFDAVLEGKVNLTLACISISHCGSIRPCAGGEGEFDSFLNFNISLQLDLTLCWKGG